MALTFDPTINLAQIGTLLSVIVAAASLLILTAKDRNLRRKQYADRIRNAAAETTARLDRWRQLSLRLYEDIQPFITQADIRLVRDRDVVATRDQLWQDLINCRLAAAQRVADEKIEVAYVNLYGYDVDIYELFSEVANNLRKIEGYYFDKLLLDTQRDVLLFGKKEEIPRSAQLGNVLRGTVAGVSRLLNEKFVEATDPLRVRLIGAINATDAELVAGRKL